MFDLNSYPPTSAKASLAVSLIFYFPGLHGIGTVGYVSYILFFLIILLK